MVSSISSKSEASKRNHRSSFPDPLLYEQRALQPHLMDHHQVLITIEVVFQILSSMNNKLYNPTLWTTTRF